MTKRYFRNIKPLDHPIATLIITATVYLFFIGLRLGVHGFDPSVFIIAGDRLCKPDLITEKIAILENSWGYDGQFYYRLALDPFTSKVSDFGVSLDSPPYRHQRIIYPFIVWLVSFGHSSYVPFLMLAVNFMALCLIGWFGGAYARSMNRHALWGLLFSLYPGFIIVLSRNLTEIVEISLLMGCLLFIRKDKQLLASIFLSLAILAKETAILMAAGIIFSFLFHRERDTGKNQIKWYLFGIPVLTYCAWQCLLFLNWQKFPVFSGSNQIGLPFAGLYNFVVSNLAMKNITQVFYLSELLLIFIFTLCVLWSFRSTSAGKYVKYSWILYGILMISLTDTIWLEDIGFLRALSDFFVLGSAIILSSQTRIRIPAFACSLALWICVFYTRVCYV